MIKTGRAASLMRDTPQSNRPVLYLQFDLCSTTKLGVELVSLACEVTNITKHSDECLTPERLSTISLVNASLTI